jgi:hypothetical protein
VKLRRGKKNKFIKYNNLKKIEKIKEERRRRHT